MEEKKLLASAVEIFQRKLFIIDIGCANKIYLGFGMQPRQMNVNVSIILKFIGQRTAYLKISHYSYFENNKYMNAVA